MTHLLLILALIVLAYATISKLVPKFSLTAPIVFLATGVLISGLLDGALHEDARELLEHLAELTLVVVLFTDASRINARVLLHELGFPIRLLGIGMPLSIVLGTVVAMLLFPSWSIWEAALLSAMLAPTDAALGQAVVESPRVPQRIREALNVESGLNDGIAVPIVLLFASIADAEMNVQSTASWASFLALQLSLGPIVGIAVGWMGGRLMERAYQRGWASDRYLKLSGIAIPVLAWAGALAIGGNGFIAAFFAGLAIGCSTTSVRSKIQEFGETEGALLSILAFTMLGATLVVPVLQVASWRDWCYAGMSLTVVRLLPVAIATAKMKAQPATRMFLGWFGPRGLATLIFALLVASEYSLPHGERIFTIAILTVVMSVILHGVTALPASNWYGRWMDQEELKNQCERVVVTEHLPRCRHSDML